MTEPLRTDRDCIGFERGFTFLSPLAADFLRLADPSLAFARAGAVGSAKHARKRHLGIAIDRGGKRIIAAERLRVDVDLNRQSADFWHRPEMRGHAAGLGAD